MSAAGFRPRAAVALASLDRPLTSYYLILGTSGLLLAVGLVMVLSTSSVSQLDSGGSPYSVFLKQLLGALAGLVIMWLLAHTPPRLLRSVAYPLLLAAIAGLILVLAFGPDIAGVRRWIAVGGIQLQPSEFAKLAFLIWGADLLARKESLGQLNDWRTLLIPLLPGAAVVGLLVVLGDDLGTTFLLLVILLALLWVIGTPARLFVGILGLVLFALVLLIKVAQYRSGRITGFLNPTLSNNWQLVQGKYAIGSGGLFGVGLGDSQLKWGWVPNDDTDFIFAILGEELGLIGTGCVVLLYSGLAFAGLRVARRVTDPFMRLAAAGATAWIVVQALVNICAVIGLLPITGVPLPLISQGLSSVLVTMAAIGMLLSFARSEPGAREALAAVTPRWRRKIAAAFGRSGADAGSVASTSTGVPRPRSPGRAGPRSARTRSAGGPARSRLTIPETAPAKAGRGRRTRGDDRAQRAPKQAPASRGPGQLPARPRSGPQRPGSAHPGQRPGPPPQGPQHS
ncbi:MAG: putative lipid II flippase FtsW [Streptosporangiaceae bacterium]